MKIYAYLAIIALVFAALGVSARALYTSGYNKRDLEVQQDILDAQETARVEEESKWRATVLAAKAQIVIEKEIVEVIRVVEKEIPKVVERIVTLHPECADLGHDYAGLLNDQVRAANTIQDSEATNQLVD